MNLPAINGNWVDLLVLLIVLFYVFEGASRGLLLGLLDVCGFILSFLASLKLYGFFGGLLVNNFSLPRGISNAAGFLIAGFLAELLFSRVLIYFYKRIFPRVLFSVNKKTYRDALFLTDRVLGVLPAVAESLLFTAFILTLFITLPIQGAIKKDILTSRVGKPLVTHTQGIERELNSIFGQAVNETLTFITVNPSSSSEEKVDLKFTTTNVRIDEAAEATMLSLLNSERTARGLRPLAVSPPLTALGRTYAKDMFARGYFSHYNPEGQSPFDRMRKAGIGFVAAGENLALAPNVHLAHQGLMNSPGHRANILSKDFGHVGIGAVDGGIYGEMFVQEFTN